MRIATVIDGLVQDFAMVDKVTLVPGTAIPAVVVGEEGRARKRAIVPVRLTPESREVLLWEGQVRVTNVALAQAPSGAQKLVELPAHDGSMEAVVVFLTTIGFRGSNGHHGAPAGRDEAGRVVFSPFPGTVLARGEIAQGDAGAMGNGEQVVALLPSKATVCVRRTGRLYGAPPVHVVEWDGESGRLSALPLAEWELKRDFADEAL